jgi:hypothetical protein
VPGTHSDIEPGPDPAERVPDDETPGWGWRWLIPLGGIIAIAVLLWLVFLPPDTTDAATEALCISTARLTLTIESAPPVSPATPREEVISWVPEAGAQVVVVADLARSIGVNINRLVASYDSLRDAARAATGDTVGEVADDIDSTIQELGAAVDDLAERAGC